MLAQSQLLQDIIRDGDTLMMVIMGGLGLIWIVLGTVGSMVKSTAKEKTRREIAAYIAEGSMTPEQGEKLMKAGRRCS